MNRREFLKTAGAGTGSVILPRDVEARHYSDHVTVARNADVQQWDPRRARDKYSLTVIANVYDTLVRRDATLQIREALAESWDVRERAKGREWEWQFKLRRNVKFHDGRPVSSQDAAYSLKEASQQFTVIGDVKSYDPYTLGVVAGPDTLLLDALTRVFIVPSGYYAGDEAQLRQRLTKDPAGSGPYRLTSWKAKERAELERSTDARFSDVQVRFLTFVIMPEKSTQVAAIATNEIQMTDDPPLKTFAESLKQQGIPVVEAPDGVAFVGFNPKDAVVSDSRVRRALSLSIDRRQIATSIPITATAAPFVIGPEVPGAPKVDEWEKYDPSAAKKLLVEAGVRSPSVELSVRADWVPVAEAVAEQWRQIGVSPKIRVLEIPTFYQALERKETSSAYLVPAPWSADPDGILYPFFHSKGRYSTSYSNQSDKLIEEARSEREPKRRSQLYSRLNEELRSDSRVIPLVQVRSVYGVRPGVAWKPRPDGWVLGSEIRIKTP